MHTPETKQRFIELRARGSSIVRIAQDLALSQATCFRWQQECRDEIANLQNAHLEAVNERLSNTYEEEMTRLASSINQVAAILASRNLEPLETPTLFRLLSSLRAEFRRLRKTPRFVDTKPQADAQTTPVPHAD